MKALGAYASTGGSVAPAKPVEAVKAPPKSPAATARQVVLELDDNTEAVDILKKSGPIGIIFVVALLVVDARSRVVTEHEYFISPYHWFGLLTVLLFFGFTWLPGFRAHWRGLSLLCCIAMISWIIRISAITHEPTTRYITIILCPFATAAFVIWGWRWQLALIIACSLLYTIAELLVPIGPRFDPHRVLGMTAALVLSQFTAVFLDRYRRKLKRQLMQLAEAAAFRETQIATMTHDIRNPLATLVGLVTLLVEDDLDDKDRANLLARVWSTTTTMDLLVKNVLDLYLLEEQRLRPNCRIIDPNAVVTETAEHCAIEARLKGLKIRLELGGVPKANIDPLHLERIIANLLTSAVRRTSAGEVRIRTFQRGEQVMIEVADTGPEASPSEVERIFKRPNLSVDGARSSALGRYIAHALVEADGGTIDARTGDGWGLTLAVQLPIDGPPT
ncbi:MAG TPA: HAMP domain-containing sensor histidine kinase [Candidatus Binataceae bacterium]|nr:HAMP domain-containing sensor histidine kinase [Candidatus Binataceae bacterium]